MYSVRLLNVPLPSGQCAPHKSPATGSCHSHVAVPFPDSGPRFYQQAVCLITAPRTPVNLVPLEAACRICYRNVAPNSHSPHHQHRSRHTAGQVNSHRCVPGWYIRCDLWTGTLGTMCHNTFSNVDLQQPHCSSAGPGRSIKGCHCGRNRFDGVHNLCGPAQRNCQPPKSSRRSPGSGHRRFGCLRYPQPSRHRHFRWGLSVSVLSRNGYIGGTQHILDSNHRHRTCSGHRHSPGIGNPRVELVGRGVHR